MSNENTKLCETCREGLSGSALVMTLRDYTDAIEALEDAVYAMGGVKPEHRTSRFHAARQHILAAQRELEQALAEQEEAA